MIAGDRVPTNGRAARGQQHDAGTPVGAAVVGRDVGDDSGTV